MRTSRWITSTLVAAFGLVTAAVAQTPAPTVETAAQRVERFLTAMGGRAAWAAVAFVHVEAVHYDLVFDHPFTNRIWNDFSRPRVRFEAKNEQIDRRRGVLDGKGWRLRDGVASKLTAEEVESDRAWWEANIYRTLHRLAVGDPDLSARATGERRLEVFRADGRRLNWFELVYHRRADPLRHLGQRGRRRLRSVGQQRQRALPQVGHPTRRVLALRSGPAGLRGRGAGGGVVRSSVILDRHAAF